MANNLNIGVNFTGNLGNLPGAAAAAAAALGGVGTAANEAGVSLTGLGNVSEHAFDEIAAGAAAMARIEASIEAMAAEARNAGTALQLIGSSAITSITPLNTLEARLRDIREAIGQSATVQGAANLGAQYEVINRNLQQTRNQIIAATTAAIGLGNAFNSIAGSASGINRLAPAIRPVLTNLTLIPPAANAAAASLARVRGNAGPAAGALTDFSRVIQDAPFGIIGIGNNITQLSESFGRLRGSAGSTGAAFKQLFTAAGGFGGIGLAISLITTAVTFASVGFGAWTRGMKDNKKAVEDADNATKEFVKNLKSVEDIAGQAAGGVQGQIVQVQALASVVTNTNGAYADRAAALRELQQINKNYFGDLKLEETQMGTLTARVNEYTQALVQQAIVKGFENEIGKVATGLYDQEKALKKSFIAFKQLEAQVEATRKTGKVFNQGFIDLQVSAEEARKTFIKQRDAVEQGRGSFIELTGAMKAAVIEGLKFRDLTNASTDADKKAEDALKKRIDALKTLRDEVGLNKIEQRELLQLEIQLLRRDGIKLGFTPDEVEQRVQALIQATRIGREAKAIPIDVTLLARPKVDIDVSAAIIPADIIPEDAFDGVIDAIRNNATKKLADLGEDIRTKMVDAIAGSIQSGLIEAADVLGTALGEIFSGNIGEALTNSANAFLGILGGILQEVGKQVVIASVLIKNLKRALNKIFGPGGDTIAAGVGFALIGLGAILKSIKIPAFAGGVENFGGGLAWVGEQGRELVNLPPGSDVIPNNRLGEINRGNTIKLEAVISGQDIYLSNQRVAGMRRRI